MIDFFKISSCFAITVGTALKTGLVSPREKHPWDFVAGVPATSPTASDRSSGNQVPQTAEMAVALAGIRHAADSAPGSRNMYSAVLGSQVREPTWPSSHSEKKK